MYSLFIDTHDTGINIALFKDSLFIDKEERQSERQHSDYTMPMIKDIIERNNISVHDLKEVFVANGPGSFTGVRIGVTIAKTLAYTMSIPIKMINTMELLVISKDSDTNKLPICRDLKGVYGGLYTSDNKLIGELFYKSNSEFNEFIEENNYQDIIIENEPINYDNLISYMKTVKEVNCHNANPIYIKEIEALKQ